MIEKQLDESITVKDEILADMPARLDWYDDVYNGFLKGKSVREWSKLKMGDEQSLLQSVYKSLQETRYWKHLALSIEEIEEILDEIYHKVQADVEISQIVNWCNALNSRAGQLKKELEDHILKPQLP